MLKTKVVLFLSVVVAILPTYPANIPADVPDIYPAMEEKYYEISGHFYTIEQIAYAVSIREGTPTCGIRMGGEYVKLPPQEAYLLCRDKLKNQIDKYGFATALKVWKTVPPFEPYIRDVISILEKNAYQR